MGQAIAQAATEAGLDVAGGTNATEGGTIGAQGAAITTDPAALAVKADVLIDFSVPAALAANIAACTAAGKPLLIGTTGLSPADHAAIDAAARDIAVLQTGNTSLGVNLLAALVCEAARAAGRRLGYRDRRDASPAQGRCAIGHGAAARRGGGGGARHRPQQPQCAWARRRDRGRARQATSASRRCGADRSRAITWSYWRARASGSSWGTVPENRFIFARGAIKAATWLIGEGAGGATPWRTCSGSEGWPRGSSIAHRVFELFSRLAESNPAPRTELEYGNDYQLLVAVVLSAQATDVGVNKATRKLFETVKTPAQMVALGEEGLKAHIRTIGLFNGKAKNVIAPLGVADARPWRPGAARPGLADSASGSRAQNGERGDEHRVRGKRRSRWTRISSASRTGRGWRRERMS